MTEPTSLDVVTLVIAIVGLVLSVVGLALRYADYRRTGSRVKVDLKRGFAGHGGVVTYEIGITPHWDGQFGIELPVYVVEVRNLGHGATTVASASVKLSGGAQVTQPGGTIGASPPHRLEGESAATFVIDAGLVERAGEVLAKSEGGASELCAMVTLSTGRVITSKPVKVRFGTAA